jgi:hypothetical protein
MSKRCENPENRGEQRPMLLLPSSNRHPLRFQLLKGDRRRFSLVEVELAKLDLAWRRSGECYVASDGSGAVKGRLERFAQWLELHPDEPIVAPYVYLNATDNVSFADGRHRFAVLRERGYKMISVAVRKKQVAAFRRLFGSEY